jgi:hypothetical protein
MLSIILISIVVVAVVFAVVNKFTKKPEQPVEQQPPVVEEPLEEPLGYETSSLAELEQPACLYPGVAKEDPGLIPVASEEPLVLAKPAKKPKAKMSAKPKAPKKKKNA